MSSDALPLTDALLDYVRSVGVREHPALAEAVERARTLPEVRPHLAEKLIVKTVWVPGRLVNFVVR